MLTRQWCVEKSQVTIIMQINNPNKTKERVHVYAIIVFCLWSYVPINRLTPLLCRSGRTVALEQHMLWLAPFCLGLCQCPFCNLSLLSWCCVERNRYPQEC
jgi:hypothetical protein